MTTNFPPPMNPLSYAVPNPKPRPTSVTVLAVIGIILASLGMLGDLISLVFTTILLTNGGKNPFAPQLPATHTPAATAIFGMIAVLIALGFGVVLLVGGIGGLKLRPWARLVMIRWSIARICWAIISLILSLGWTIPATAHAMRQGRGAILIGSNGVGSNGAPIFMIVGALLAAIIACVMPVLFLIFWRSDKVVAAFENSLLPEFNTMPAPLAQPYQADQA